MRAESCTRALAQQCNVDPLMFFVSDRFTLVLADRLSLSASYSCLDYDQLVQSRTLRPHNQTDELPAARSFQRFTISSSDHAILMPRRCHS